MSAMHILIIDDNLANLRVLSTLLLRQGFACTEVSDPLAVESRLAEIDPVDLVFLDLEMPDLNGYEMLYVLRQSLGEIPVIAHSIHDNELHVASQSGFNGFVGKPLNSARFSEQLARIMRGESVWERG